MRVVRGRQPQQSLNHPLNMRSGKQVIAACDQCYALTSIVDCHREMVGGGHLLSRDYHIAEEQWIYGYSAALAARSKSAFLKAQFTDARLRRMAVKPQCVWNLFCHSAATFLV